MSTLVKTSRSQRAEATREALLEAARRLFGERGFAGTSLEDVVVAAGVTKGALYHHFTDKEELFREVTTTVKREVNARLSDLLLGLDAFATLEVGCSVILDAYLDPAIRQIVWTDARAVLSPSAYGEIQSRSEQVFLRAALRRAMREGVIEPLPLIALTALLTGAIGEGCSYVASANDPVQARADVERTVHRLLTGLRTTRTD